MNKQTNYLREMSDSSMRKEPKKRIELQVSSLIEHYPATEWPLCQQSHIHSCSQECSSTFFFFLFMNQQKHPPMIPVIDLSLNLCICNN